MWVFFRVPPDNGLVLLLEIFRQSHFPSTGRWLILKFGPGLYTGSSVPLVCFRFVGDTPNFNTMFMVLLRTGFHVDVVDFGCYLLC